ncbi:MAG TPA: hypothetical protein VK955_05040 [Xanthobacteraceae bacterium]|nr:hypothetical protein [Xanthobacteraceae bacterium]
MHAQLATAGIGKRLGFDDPACFARCFARENGVAPRESRRLRYD